MNVETLERSCKDASRIFFNNGSIGVVVRPNRDSLNDKGEGVIGDIPLLHMEQSPFFWIERNDQEEECLKLLFKHAQLQNMTYSSK